MSAAVTAIIRGTNCPRTADTAGGATPGNEVLMQDDGSNASGIDDAFGHWLAGFVDGEGCFSMLSHNVREAYSCQFLLTLRDDDEAILREIQARTGLGSVARRTPKLSHGQTYWTVHRKEDCIALVAIFDRFPLRAKKARDYAIWRDAVIEWSRWTGQRVGKSRRKPYIDWRRMAMLKHQLHAVRRYPGRPPLIAEETPLLDLNQQLTILED